MAEPAPVKVVVLDSLFESLDVETLSAAERGASLERWDGTTGALADADVVAHVRTAIGPELIAAMPRCRVITRFGTGRDTVDVPAAEAAGIRIVTVRDYCIPELPAQTLALALTLARRLGETAGRLDLSWQQVASETPIVRYACAAVVGIGAVGRRVAAALAALGYEIVAVTQHAREEVDRNGWRLATLEEALAAADIIFLHVALDDSTRGMIDARRLELVRPGAILVNTARLGLIDQAAVVAALESGRLGGLALDAKLEPESPLRRFAHDPRVVITPHIGWHSRESAAILRAAAIADALEAAGATREVTTR
jgi:phosphoglycerate dehydrogenase-like enzyme